MADKLLNSSHPRRWRDAWDDVQQSPAASSFPVRVAALVAVYWWLVENLTSAGRLPQQAYEQTVILWQCIKHDPPEVLFFLLAPWLAMATAKGRRGWDVIGNGRATRWLIIAVVASLAWGFSTYNYNHYYDQSHLWDRFLLIAFAVGCWFHPAFVFPFVVQTVAIATQFHYPIGQYSWTDKILPIRVLMIFAASLVTALIWKRRVARDFALVASCAIASHYFIPGLAKAELSWWEHNQLHHLTASAYTNGWMNWIDDATFGRLLRFIQSQNQIGLWMTLILEIGAVAMLVHRRVAFGFLLGWILLHFGIMLSSGICFWKWIILDASFMLYLFRLPGGMKRWLFAPPRFAMSALLIVFGTFFFKPIKLGWYDTRVSYTFDFSGRGESGAVYEISKEAMAPYDIYFSQNRLFFLTDRRRLTETYGSTKDPSIARKLSQPPRDRQDLLELESQLGSSQYDAEKSARCVDFVERFFGTWNQRLDRTNSTVLRAPFHIWTDSSPGSYDGQEPLSAVKIHMTTWVYEDDHAPRRVSHQLLREISLDPSLRRHTDPESLAADEAGNPSLRMAEGPSAARQ